MQQLKKLPINTNTTFDFTKMYKYMILRLKNQNLKMFPKFLEE